jgi:class 3 adenylate cyclase
MNVTMPGRGRGRRIIPHHWSILVIDISGFGRWGNLAQLSARAALDLMVRDAFRAAGVARRKLVIEDRGDGMIVLISSSVSKVDILDLLIPRLTERLREYNEAADPLLRIRLRISVHAGEILRDASGWVGTDLNLACRLVNSEPVYRRLSQSPASQVVLVVSDMIYDGVVRHGYRTISPTGYSPVRVAVKEVNARAWVHLPDQQNH